MEVYEKETQSRMGGGPRRSLAGAEATELDSKVKEKKVREEKAATIARRMPTSLSRCSSAFE